jgi:hypothetical protein
MFQTTQSVGGTQKPYLLSTFEQEKYDLVEHN